MAFMEVQIHRGSYWAVTNHREDEAYFIPHDSDAGYAVKDAMDRMASEDENSRPDVIEVEYFRKSELAGDCKRVLARLSAPGYLDCTEWTPYDSEEEAREDLEPDEEDEEDDAESAE
jgi:hypothetical protein